MFHLSRVVGHLGVTFEYLFVPVFDGLAIRILVLCLRLVETNVTAAECGCLVVSVI